MPFVITILSAIALICAIFCLKRPTYEPKYIISKDEYLMDDLSKNSFNCNQKSFPRGNYIDNINFFTFKKEDLNHEH